MKYDFKWDIIHKKVVSTDNINYRSPRSLTMTYHYHSFHRQSPFLFQSQQVSDSNQVAFVFIQIPRFPTMNRWFSINQTLCYVLEAKNKFQSQHIPLNISMFQTTVKSRNFFNGHLFWIATIPDIFRKRARATVYTWF